MGIFDRLLSRNKKYEESRVSQPSRFEPAPLSLRHSDGRVENIYFNGLMDVYGKALMVVGIDQGEISSDGTRMVKNYYVEPVYSRDASGNVIEITEDYYREFGIHPDQGGDAERYNAIKGFFQAREITKEKIGSNYIGGLAVNQNGEYYRQYDEDFKSRYIGMIKNQELAEQQRKEKIRAIAEQERQNLMKSGLAEQLRQQTQDPSEYDIRTGEAGVLTSEQRERIDRYSQMV